MNEKEDVSERDAGEEVLDEGIRKAVEQVASIFPAGHSQPRGSGERAKEVPSLQEGLLSGGEANGNKSEQE